MTKLLEEAKAANTLAELKRVVVKLAGGKSPAEPKAPKAVKPKTGIFGK